MLTPKDMMRFFDKQEPVYELDAVNPFGRISKIWRVIPDKMRPCPTVAF